ncbi:hypothetical protein LSH36_626g03013 [Paralvinella palmiformis]|uniref:ADAMTS-like protein 3 n=1 Tax=Paralvinella palmiformis TaxID=53620 RepID=A0AAD9J521_9ANNE|nr:hypothetical protein LSH36_626g03013 [Paralvinella palmiformis]
MLLYLMNYIITPMAMMMGDREMENWYQVLPVDTDDRWSSWSTWSECSRTCDGGAAYQIRHRIEENKTSCVGETIRYKTCNNEQCQSYDDVPYRGVNYKWQPYYDQDDPCSLQCTAEGSQLRLVLAPKTLGCDHVLGSVAKEDICGVCGGDGSSCLQKQRPKNGHPVTSSSAFVWEQSEYSPCSVSCGVGEQVSTPVCVDTKTGRVVFPTYCDRTTRPVRRMRVCTQPSCHPTMCQWFSLYTLCSCVFIQCSVTCGRGVQYREVICKPTKSHNCSLDDKPITKLQCDAGVNCVKPKDEENLSERRPQITKLDNRPKLQVVEANDPSPTNLFFQVGKEPAILPQPLLPIHPPDGAEQINWETGSGFWDADTADNDAMKALLSKPAALFSDSGNEITLSTTPTFVTSTWSECSNTCGTGLRNRRVLCRVYVEFAGTVQTLPDNECIGPKPAETEICKRRSCDHVSPLEKDVYIWSFTGYGPCNATCIGGYKNATFSCKRVRDFATVSSHYCQHIHLPDMEPQRCNVIPCTPQWQAYPTGPCSALCGGGYQIQRILCVRRYGWGREDIQIIKSQYCLTKEEPPKKIVCNTQPCPPSWRVGPWSKCSKTCGNGSQTRDVICEQKLGPGVAEELMNERLCVGVKPATTRYCDLPRCPGRSYKEYIIADNSWLVQMAPLSKIYIDVGGRATVLPRTTVKVRCRVRKINRKLIIWKRDGVVVPEKGRIRRSRKGLLLIRKSRPTDTGLYTCEAGYASQNITILFHSLDSAAGKLAERRHMIARLGKFYSDARISDAKASLVAIEKQFRHWSAIPFHYVTTEWSECSKSCGGAGLQNRRISCDLVLPSYYFIVRDEFCMNRGLEKPADSRDCGFEKCPHWECSKTCGGKGFKTRAINCIWALTGKPAGDNCKYIRRPELRKECNSPKTCVTGCRDRSKYCSLIPRLNFCRFKQYSEECCESCAAHEEYEKHQMRMRKRV